ncbi:hypothetical protein HRR83_008101 [Exophiala dermatitidis]|uniref:CST complex subunit Stn1 N-terminal domain-containing protein n=1 Tax=Exophiala dermatitidis TaxID=5970 RepID=A0AAN6ITQ4_EXODE|nr:hypothetical protein HRR75_008131 [Exophiala dermatitidis]KAJ4505023.1 hypothetical protein HRR74_008851 [Exophiala dermatitidis]KAJ4513531.1 hypothetical protein HRR73_005689 [Exophiala dermatitidis]KAJ4535691.1 hypothetical protein HRR77_007639 [Exophiala dermatitidis]KAJ4541806.1 hypothetical protein HRR78_007084 [Exophiala dermatitidis]
MPPQPSRPRWHHEKNTPDPNLLHYASLGRHNDNGINNTAKHHHRTTNGAVASNRRPSTDVVDDSNSGSDSDSDSDSDSESTDSSEKSQATPTQPTFYPAYTFKASATWFKWVKLTAWEIHCVLQRNYKYAADITTTTIDNEDRRQAYGGGLPPPPPLLLFYLNHPIQFVQVVGVVVVFEDFFEKFWLFTVDDGSGATIDVTCSKPEKEKQTHNLPLRSSYNAPSNNNNKSAGAGMEDKPKTTITSASTATEIEGAARNDKDNANADAEQLLLQATLSKLHVGAVVQAKGTLSTFRSVRQLTLLRLTVLPDTAHEMALISSRTGFCRSTLSKPWVLSADELKSLAREAQDEKDQDQRRAARRRERLKRLEQREQRHAKHIREQYEADEKRRMKAANAARRAGEILQHGPTTK